MPYRFHEYIEKQKDKNKKKNTQKTSLDVRKRIIKVHSRECFTDHIGVGGGGWWVDADEILGTSVL